MKTKQYFQIVSNIWERFFLLFCKNKNLMHCYVLSPYPSRRFDLWNRLWLEHSLISYCLLSIHLFAKKTMFLEQSYCCSWEIYDDRKKQLTISVRGNYVRFSFWSFSRPTKAPFINSEQYTGIRSPKCLNLCNFF